MKTFAAVLLSLMVSFSGISQNWNMSQCFRYDDPNLPFRGPVAYNDVWGYVCPAGEEVGIIGTVDSIFFLKLRVPAAEVYEKYLVSREGLLPFGETSKRIETMRTLQQMKEQKVY